MKTFRIFMMLLFVTSIASAQDLSSSDIPEPVLKAFSNENSNASNVEWEKDRENYKVEFFTRLVEHEIWYSETGEVVKKVNEMDPEELPDAVTEAINLRYEGFNMDEVEMTWENDETTYKVELANGKEEWKLIVDAEGNILQELPH